MKKTHSIAATFFLGLLASASPGMVLADPPTRAIRLSTIEGTVTFAPASVDQWVYATRNRPLTIGDRLWSDTNSRARLQLSSAQFCLGNSTSFNLLNFDNQAVQIELDQGEMTIQLLDSSGNQTYEVDTPNLAFTVDKPGRYNISVDTSNQTTTVTVRQGQASIYGKNNAYQINAGESYLFSGADLNPLQSLTFAEPDSLDQWCLVQKPQRGASISSQYVSRSVVGQEDLDAYGNWQSDPVHQQVWYPSHVSSDWAPYSQGQWIWVEPWGWSWVDEAPWGFAPFHYGRWVYLSQGWGWVPGPVVDEAIYAPALVAFFGEVAIGLAGGGIGWFPLGPGDIYIPPFAYSHNYFSRINRSNAFLNPAVVMHAYQNPRQSFNYSNMKVPHAITAVSKASFIHSLPVGKAAIAVPKLDLQKSHPTGFAPLAPVKASVIGASTTVHLKPSAKVLAQPIVAKTTPPAPPVSFAAKQAILDKNPGKPLATNELLNLKPAAGPVRQVTIVHPSQPLLIPAGSKSIGNMNIHKPPVNAPTKAVLAPNPKSGTGVPHPPPISSTPVFIEHKPLSPKPVQVIPHGGPNGIHQGPAHIVPRPATNPAPQPARVTPHVVPSPRHQPATVEPKVVPRPQPARVAPNIEPKVELKTQPLIRQVAPHLRPNIERRPLQENRVIRRNERRE